MNSGHLPRPFYQCNMIYWAREMARIHSFLDSFKETAHLGQRLLPVPNKCFFLSLPSLHKFIFKNIKQRIKEKEDDRAVIFASKPSAKVSVLLIDLVCSCSAKLTPPDMVT